jgi:hypothetical protein
MMQPSPRNFAEFWPDYVLAHHLPLTRGFHVFGTVLGWVLLACAVILRKPWLALVALAASYSMAWISHFFVEHNRPATFGHPLWSFLADQKMLALALAGKMDEEVRRCEEGS